MLGACLAVALGGVAGAGAPEPVELRASAFPAHSGLRLVVAAERPYVLDVDSGAITPIRGLPQTRDGLSVVPVSARAAVLVAWGDRTVNKRLYVVHDGRAAASPLGRGREVVPDADGSGIWVTRVASPGRCLLQRIGLDGHRAAARAIPCSWIIARGGDLGLVVHRTRIVDPRTGRTVVAARQGVLAVAGDRMLVAGGPRYAPGYRFTLENVPAGTRQTLRWPSIVGALDDALPDPQGRSIAIAFADPAWHQSGSQVQDIWVLDTRTGALSQAPGMPSYVSLKGTSMAWAGDGRLVLFGETDGRGFVIAWRPGQRALPLEFVQRPPRTGGSDTFAPLG